MPAPELVTTWPTGDDLRTWLGDGAVSAVTDAELIDEVVADASALIYEQLNPDLLPTEDLVGGIDCPRRVARAIVLEAARLLYRTQSPHGAAVFNEIAIRLRAVDADVEQLIAGLSVDTDP